MPKLDNGRKITNPGESQKTMIVQCNGITKTITNARVYNMWIRLHNKRCDCLGKELPAVDADLSYNLYKKTGKILADSEWKDINLD